MLGPELFKTIVNHTPLVSIDICLLNDDEILMCKRNNNPLKGEWFTPGGRIYKNEKINFALSRICNVELGLEQVNTKDFIPFGAWDHIFDNSIFGENISTHYINLPHYCSLSFKPKIKLDSQHNNFQWIKLVEIADNEKYHIYMRKYARYLIDIVKC